MCPWFNSKRYHKATARPSGRFPFSIIYPLSSLISHLSSFNYYQLSTTINYQLSTINYQLLSTINYPLSTTINSQLSTINYPLLSTINSQLSTIHYPLSTLNYYQLLLSGKSGYFAHRRRFLVRQYKITTSG